MVTLAEAITVLYPSAQPLTDYRVQEDGTGAVLTAWNTAALGAQPSQATLDAVTQAQVDAALTALLRTQAKALYDLLTTHTGEAKVVRALVAVLLDEINTLRGWLASFKTEVAAAASLADLKTRVATLPPTPDRTPAQAKTAITQKIDGGSVD